MRPPFIHGLDSRVSTPPNLPGPAPPTKRKRAGTTGRARAFLTAVCKGEEKEVTREVTRQTMKLCHPLTGCSALHLAVLYEHHNILAILLEHRPHDIDQRDNEGRTALHYAAALCDLGGDPSLYYTLTENGARDDVQDLEGFNPLDVRQNPSLIDLSRARYQNTYPVVVDNEWDCLFSSQSESSLTCMILQGELDLSMAPPLPQHEEVYSRLALLQARLLGIWDSIQAGDDRTLKQLLCERTLAMCRDGDGRTPLHMAFKRGYQPSIEYLLYLCPEASEVRDKKGLRPSDYSKNALTVTPLYQKDRRVRKLWN